MSSPADRTEAPAPRLLLVLAGAASQVSDARTPLEQAVLPQLRALAGAGRAARRRPVAPHLPLEEASAAAALLGVTPPMPLDPGAVATASLGLLMASDESCTVIEVGDGAGRPAPTLEVQRAAEALRGQFVWNRMLGTRAPHELLVAGALPPRLPSIDGLTLRALPHGFLPAARLSAQTVIVAERGSALLGVGALLGARTIISTSHSADPAARAEQLRAHALAELVGGAGTVIVESRAALEARRVSAGEAARRAAVLAALEAADRTLVGPLWAAATWAGASFAVTSDLPRLADGTPVDGDVPSLLASPRHVLLPEPAPLLSPLGTAPPPRYSERALAELPAVATPFALAPLGRPVREPRVRDRRPLAAGLT